MTELAFLAQEIPSAGYETYGLGFASGVTPPAATGLKVDESGLALENELVRVRLDPITGAVASLAAKPSGADFLNPDKGAFPRFRGRPNSSMSLRPDPPASYDSGTSKAQIDWLARGPLWATVRAQHSWKYLKFETRVTLAAGSPHVEVITRVLAQVPPRPDVSPPDIKEGYWLSFAPGFPVVKILRDYPFGVEETKNQAFHALTFADFVGRDRGLLALHAGTQYFRREDSGRFSNLIMREWESYFSHEYGWPSYAEYRHGLMPHGGNLQNADRLRAAAEFARPLLCYVKKPQAGDLPASGSFLAVSPPGLSLTAFRKKAGGGFELRLVENEGCRAEGEVVVCLPVSRAAATDLLGNRLAAAELRGGRLSVSADPWKILTFHLD
jgi:hypothetical protein